jgi:long-chain acyl-CoA synthetase
MSDFTAKFPTLLDIYTNSIEQFVDRPLFGTKRGGSWEWTTYGEFGEMVDNTRSGLAGLGIGLGDKVAIISDNREEWAVVAYAAYGLGAAVVPMYEAQTTENWAFVLGDSDSRAVFVSTPDVAERLDTVRGSIDGLEYLFVMEGAAPDDWGTLAVLQETGSKLPVGLSDVGEDQIAGFVYTSGTTGKPKGVLLSQKNLAYNVSSITDVFPIYPTDRTLSFLPWAHAFGQTVELHTIFAMGGSTAFATSVAEITSNLPEVKPTMLVSVPTIFGRIYTGLNKRMAEGSSAQKMIFDQAMSNATKRRNLAEQGKSSWFVDMQQNLFDKLVFSKIRAGLGGNLTYAISGGAAIPVEVAEFIDNLGVTVYEGYGLSETSPIATANWPGTRKIGSVGKPIPGTSVSLDTAASADPRDGEIVIYGHNVMQGYHNRPEENAKVFTDDGGFRSGDLGRIDDDGFLFITGRVKEQYKLENGKYVVPTPIEEKIGLSAYIANVMVYGDNKPFNVAVIVPDAPAVEEWAAAEGVEFENFEGLVEDPRVRQLIGDEVDKAMADVKGYEKVRAFVIAPEDFSTENGMLTPTLKVKRRIVIDHYGDEIQALYAE